MTAVQASSGWYPDPNNVDAQRYFDGTDWTQHYAPNIGDVERADRLAVAVAHYVAVGWRVESQSMFSAVLVAGHPTNNVAHLLGMLVTCGLWIIGWIIAMMFEKPERRITLRVDPYGAVIRV